MPTTTNYSWTTPADTDLVKDGASAIRTLGSAIDTTTKNLNPSTTLGDIEYRSSTANTNTRLAIGSTGQVLTVSGGVPAWATAPSGGMTLINTGGTTLTGSSVTIGSIPGTYYNLQLVIRDFRPATDAKRLALRINGASSGDPYLNITDFNSTGAFSANEIYLSNNSDDGASDSLVVCDFYDYANTSTWKMVRIQGVTNDSSTPANANRYFALGYYNSTSAITSIDLLSYFGANFTSGTAYLYGVK